MSSSDEQFDLAWAEKALGIPAATLAALRAGTHVVVPRERTEAMHQGAQSTTGAIVTRRHSTEIWNAMLAAAPEPGHDR